MWCDHEKNLGQMDGEVECKEPHITEKQPGPITLAILSHQLGAVGRCVLSSNVATKCILTPEQQDSR